jgi:hypothetical protein
MAKFTSIEIKLLLAALPLGKINAIHAANLALKLGYSAAPNQEELRALIREAIDQGELIGSSNSGYWIMDSRAEVEKVLKSLKQRAQGVCDRRNNLLNSWNVRNPTDKSVLTNLNVK